MFQNHLSGSQLWNTHCFETHVGKVLKIRDVLGSQFTSCLGCISLLFSWVFFLSSKILTLNLGFDGVASNQEKTNISLQILCGSIF